MAYTDQWKEHIVGKMAATILNFKSPTHISVRLDVLQEGFTILKNKLNCLYNAREKSRPRRGAKQSVSGEERKDEIEVGQCFACFIGSIKSWARVQVVKCLAGHGRIIVNVLDYGVMEEVDVRKLRDLDNDFYAENSYAFYCHLPHLEPTNQEGGVDSWHSVVIDDMKKMLEQYGPDVEVAPSRGAKVVVWTDEVGCQRKSLPVSICWVRLEAATCDAPSIEVVTDMSSVLRKALQFAVKVSNEGADYHHDVTVDIDDIPEDATAFGLAKEVEALRIVNDVSDEGEEEEEEEDTTIIAQVQCDTDPDFRWLNPELPTEREFFARMTHIDDSGQIYLHEHEKRSTFRIIRGILQDKFKGSTWSPSDRVPEGQECIARYRDNMWYRGRVLEYQGDMVFVLFVDYGNTADVKIRNIRSTIWTKEEPILAIRVVFHDVVAIANGAWSPETLDYLQELLHYDHPGRDVIVKVRVVGDSREMPLTAAIGIQSEHNGVWLDVGEILVRRAEAVEQPLEKTVEMKRRWKQEARGVGYVPAGHHAAIRSLERSFRSGESGSTWSDRFPPSQLLSVVRPGDQLLLKLTETRAVVSYDTIYVQPVASGCQGAGDCRRPSPAVDEVTRLARQFDKMEEDMSRLTDRMPPVISPTVGLPVAARHTSTAEGWYRAVICQKSGVRLLLEYVDYGPFRDWVDNSQVRELPEPCQSVPAMAMELRLCVTMKDHDKDLTTALMKECLLSLDSILRVLVVSVAGGVLNCHIIRKTGGSSRPVYDSLHKEGGINIMEVKT